MAGSHTELVEHLVKSVVMEPEAVRVEAQDDRDGVTYFVTVAPNDVGKVIGKSGRVISAIRYVVSAAAAKVRERAFVKVST
ncbi:MAG TPA: KH domain-containing protein [Fimbriimonadaceae bacterium]|nr:KH domain-containing protein [Fimbriimonadaceae bacterium]HRJ33651.1 KH domain-containing protein [Fimbriimonadaceae bacterium]